MQNPQQIISWVCCWNNQQSRQNYFNDSSKWKNNKSCCFLVSAIRLSLYINGRVPELLKIIFTWNIHCNNSFYELPHWPKIFYCKHTNFNIPLIIVSKEVCKYLKNFYKSYKKSADSLDATWRKIKKGVST